MSTITNPTPTDLTGRDNIIMAEALWYAIKYQEGLPDNLQERSNMRDMMKILRERYPEELAFMFHKAAFQLKLDRASKTDDKLAWLRGDARNNGRPLTSRERNECIRLHEPPRILQGLQE